MNNSINLERFKVICKYLIQNNRRLQETGGKPTAVCIESDAGTGKTSVIEQIAQEEGMNFVKLVLSQLEEIGDLVGYPVKEYAMVKGEGETKKGKWVTEESINQYIQAGYKVTGKPRMTYATPSWVPKEAQNGTILLLDDFTRCQSVFSQAVMELIDRGEYISWKLPKNTTICLTSNPDDGSYNVVGLDDAQKTRMVNFNVEFDLEVWAKWAEAQGLRNEAINFALCYPEIFEKKNNVIVANARSYVTFCNAISGLEKWDSPKSLEMILDIAKGCFLNDKNNSVGTFFTTFIANKLDKLIPPKDMMFGKWEDVENKIYSCTHDGDKYKPEVASVLATRILNYCRVYFDKKGSQTAPIEQRLVQIIDSPHKLFDEDVVFHVIKNLTSEYKTRTNVLLMNPKVQSKLV